ncbi:hypothetical protein CNMCM7691_001188 [Aspergillus felis]|uniref:NWD NACHT-NTPase N-terminal domain-containing protein n=1 Tax=Aspergillus felis TaxID=1287682 RepID=A0A8H6QNN5_9EURO|nr:hypothetical protein CNMCM7691_001188 [Aspergillus felis]
MGLFSKIREVRQKKKTSGLKGSAELPSPSIGPPTYRPTSPEPSSQPTPEATPLPRSDFEPWTRAYEILQTREPELIEDYKKHLGSLGSLGSLQRDGATDADLSTPRSVESIVKQLLDDREKKQWRVSLLGKESDPVVKNALSAQPYAALAWSGVSLILPLLTSGTSKNEAMLRGFNLIGDVQVYWDICEKTHIPPLKAEEIRQNRDSQLREMRESRTILDEIQMVLEAESKQTRRNYEDQKEQDLLQDFAADYKDYKDFNPARVQGTCEWFFKDDRFCKWRDSNTSGLLWVSAGPGCGKSVLSRALVDERRLSTNISTSTVCYFFFKDGDEHRIGLIGHALPSHKNYGKSLAQNFSELWQILMDSANSLDTGEIVCVLDALDECSKDGRKQLINKLKEFYYRPSRTTNPLSKLKFLITSRPYDDLEESFKGVSDTTVYLRFDGDEKSAQISKEVNLVIDAKVDEIARDFKEALQKQWFISYTELKSNLWSPKVFKSIMRNLCGLFISVYDSKLSFIHQTAREFLIHPERKGKWQGRLNMSKSHGKMSLVCLTYLSYLYGQSPVTEIKAQKCPLAQYSARYWMDHARPAETQKDIQESILNFFPAKGSPYGEMGTPLYYASLAGLQRTVELLIEKGADVNAQGGDYGYALQAASYQGHKEVVQLLLEKGADVNAQGGLFGNALQAASLQGHKDVMQQLLEKGAEVNAQGGHYHNALQAASEQGYKDIVQLLLEKGADVSAQGGHYIERPEF